MLLIQLNFAMDASFHSMFKRDELYVSLYLTAWLHDKKACFIQARARLCGLAVAFVTMQVEKVRATSHNIWIMQCPVRSCTRFSDSVEHVAGGYDNVSMFDSIFADYWGVRRT